MLAETDAIWLPLRSWLSPAPANRYFARLAFTKDGVRWASGGKTEAERKAVQRDLESLAAVGLVKVKRTRLVKTLAVRLSPAAEARARILCGLPGLYSGWVTVAELARHSKRPGAAKLLTDLWVSEHKLFAAGLTPDERRREAVLVEDLALPALTRGYVRANADGEGRVYYCVTPRGWAWLDRGKAPPDNPDTPHDPDARELYMATISAATSRLDNAEPEAAAEIGGVPLPVALAGLPLGEDPGLDAWLTEAL